MAEVDEELSEIFTELWNLDENCCYPGVDYELDMQGYVTYKDRNKDKAADKLFLWLDEEKVFSRPTYAKFRALLDNYESEVGVQETVTPEELQENFEFVRECLRTPLLRAAHRFLSGVGRSPSNEAEFQQQLERIWFGMYKRARGGRRGLRDSCSFEHVFVGESRDESTIGLHNWLQFYLLELRGCIDYRGFYRRGTSNEESPRVVSLKFAAFGGAGKPKGSSFIGVSPEFELAVYTIAFLCCTRTETRVRVGPYELDLVCHRMGELLSSCYPQLVE